MTTAGVFAGVHDVVFDGALCLRRLRCMAGLLTHHPAASQFWDSYTDRATQMQTCTACRVLAPDQPLTYQTSCLWPCLALTYAATKYVMHISTCIFMDPGKCLTEKSKCFVQSLLVHV